MNLYKIVQRIIGTETDSLNGYLLASNDNEVFKQMSKLFMWNKCYFIDWEDFDYNTKKDFIEDIKLNKGFIDMDASHGLDEGSIVYSYELHKKNITEEEIKILKQLKLIGVYYNPCV